jgi:hypothetical protein
MAVLNQKILDNLHNIKKNVLELEINLRKTNNTKPDKDITKKCLNCGNSRVDMEGDNKRFICHMLEQGKKCYFWKQKVTEN